MGDITKVSIITLTYNNYRLLEKAIRSITMQSPPTHYEVEYLVVDDGSKEFDRAYVEGLLAGKNINYRIIVNEKNVGTVASFNNAIRQSRGDIIIPLSADDEFFDPQVVNDIVAFFESHPYQVITGLRQCEHADGRHEVVPTAQQRTLFNHRAALLEQTIFKRNIISGACTYYRRTIFDAVGFFSDEYRLLEDHPYYIKLLTQGYDIGLLDRVVIKYAVGGVASKKNKHPLLVADLQHLKQYLLTGPLLTRMEKRRFYYFKTQRSRQRLYLAPLYVDQLLWALCRKITALWRRNAA